MLFEGMSDYGSLEGKYLHYQGSVVAFQIFQKDLFNILS
jgi:hypothetical protein